VFELLTGFPDGVVAFKGKGRATNGDYDDIVIRAVEVAVGKRNKLRGNYQSGNGFSGMDCLPT